MSSAVLRALIIGVGAAPGGMGVGIAVFIEGLRWAAHGDGMSFASGAMILSPVLILVVIGSVVFAPGASHRGYRTAACRDPARGLGETSASA